MQDLFYNPQRKTGWFYGVLKKRQKALTKSEKNALKQKNQSNRSKRIKYDDNSKQEGNTENIKGDIDQEMVSNDAMSAEYSKEEAIKDIAFLRSCKLNDANMSIIREKLKLTVKERLKMVQDDKTSLLERFPYFFSEPKLVNQFIFV